MDELVQFLGLSPFTLPNNFRDTPHHIIDNQVRLLSDGRTVIRLDEEWREVLTDIDLLDSSGPDFFKFLFGWLLPSRRVSVDPVLQARCRGMARRSLESRRELAEALDRHGSESVWIVLSATHLREFENDLRLDAILHLIEELSLRASLPWARRALQCLSGFYRRRGLSSFRRLPEIGASMMESQNDHPGYQADRREHLRGFFYLQRQNIGYG